jgi:hypothetical protein
VIADVARKDVPSEVENVAFGRSSLQIVDAQNLQLRNGESWMRMVYASFELDGCLFSPGLGRSTCQLIGLK